MIKKYTAKAKKATNRMEATIDDDDWDQRPDDVCMHCGNKTCTCSIQKPQPQPKNKRDCRKLQFNHLNFGVNYHV